ncbi:MAG: hypothetical protein ACOH2V_13480 [Candidatus Saccharimonadaceae bacterium]
MKTIMFKSAFPFLAFFVAIFGAFAFQNGPSDELTTNHFGAIPMEGQPCEETLVKCTDVITSNLCKQGSTILYRVSGTSCPAQLWKP